jgi:hypothetical protein
MLSVVPVAMAMLPEKVVQVERADASPEFWMVAVPEALHDAARADALADGSEVVRPEQRGYDSDGRHRRLTRDCSSSGEGRGDESGCHCGCLGVSRRN